MNCSRIFCLLFTGCLGAAVAAPQTAATAARTDSESEAVKEAIRFERYKLAAARAQMQKDGRRAEAAPQPAEQPSQPKTAPAKSDNQAVQEAVQFERHKIAAARAQERKDATETAQAPKPEERRRYSRR